MSEPAKVEANPDWLDVVTSDGSAPKARRLLGFRQDLIDQAHRDSVELILEVIGAQRGLDEDLWTLTTEQADRLIEAIRAEDDA